jgi:isopentenyl-diphosphate delta-isomerase
MNRTVTLTDQTGSPLGEADILEAHTGAGKLHKAFSVYVFNTDKTSLLIQQRAEKKMLFSLIWANTCCSHPFPNEIASTAGERRLKEELGFSVPLKTGATFVYRAEDPQGKGVEHEYVTTLIGTAPQSLKVEPNPDEVAAYKWIKLSELQEKLITDPEKFAPWFHLGLPLVLACEQKNS